MTYDLYFDFTSGAQVAAVEQKEGVDVQVTDDRGTISLFISRQEAGRLVTEIQNALSDGPPGGDRR